MNFKFCAMHQASAEARAEINELLAQLEAKNPTPSPNEVIHLLDFCILPLAVELISC